MASPSANNVPATAATEEIRAKMLGLKLPPPSPSAGGCGGGDAHGHGLHHPPTSAGGGGLVTDSSAASSPAGSWASRPARPRPRLNVGPGSSSVTSTPGAPRRPPGSLTLSTTPSPGVPEKHRFASGNLSEHSVMEQERKIRWGWGSTRQQTFFLT